MCNSAYCEGLIGAACAKSHDLTDALTENAVFGPTEIGEVPRPTNWWDLLRLRPQRCSASGAHVPCPRDVDPRLPDDCCEEGRARNERHSREEHRCLQPCHQPIVTHGAPQLLDVSDEYWLEKLMGC
jgi:hypothetical protein